MKVFFRNKRGFLLESLVFLSTGLYHLKIGIIWFFLFYLYPFYVSLPLFILVKNSNTILKKKGERRDPCLDPELRKWFQFLHIYYDVGYRFIIHSLLHWGMFFLFLLWKGYIHENMLNFVKGIFCIYWDDLFFFLYLVYVLYYIYLFVYAEPSLDPWNEMKMIMLYDLLNMLLNLIYKYFIERFYIYVDKGNWPIVFLFLSCLYTVIGSE
jgi:hypothetical protein